MSQLNPYQPSLDAMLRQISMAVKGASVSLHATGSALAQITQATNYIKWRYGGSSPMAVWGEQFSAEAQDLKIGSLFGVRYWNVTTPWHDDTGQPCVRLTGARSFRWAPGENLAVCANNNAVRVPAARKPQQHPYQDSMYEHITFRPHTFDEIPTRECGCGFWAYWTPDAAFGNIINPDVAGVVEGWGGHRTGTKGFRCSRARVVALAVVPREEDWRTALEGALAASYQVPIFSQLDTLLRRFPPSRGAQARPGPVERCQYGHYHPVGEAPALCVTPLHGPVPAPNCTCTACEGVRLVRGYQSMTPIDALGVLDAKKDSP